jgi:hypothetical protein
MGGSAAIIHRCSSIICNTLVSLLNTIGPMSPSWLAVMARNGISARRLKALQNMAFDPV